MAPICKVIASKGGEPTAGSETGEKVHLSSAPQLRLCFLIFFHRSHTLQQVSSPDKDGRWIVSKKKQEEQAGRYPEELREGSLELIDYFVTRGGMWCTALT